MSAPIKEVETATYKRLASALDNRISLHVEQIPLEQAIYQITRGTDLDVIYSKVVSAAEKHVSLALSNVTLFEALHHAARQADLEIKLSESGQILLTPALKSYTEAIFVGTVEGQIIDARTKDPLPGVNVIIQGSTIGASTDGEGRYVITNAPEGEQVIEARFIGFQTATQSVTIVSGQTVEVNFEMRESAISLSDVVVTATGEQSKREVGNAVSQIDAAELAEVSAASDVASLIQGNATGVNIQGASGTVGNAVNIKIRGNSSINLDNTPLVYIDGARVNTSARSRGVGGAQSDRLLDISPDEIESIEIVKGPAAATLYGTEAAAGVIRITTKRGVSGRARITFRSEYGTAWDANDYPARGWNPSVDLGTQYADTTYYINTLKGSADVENEGAYYNPFRTGVNRKLGLSMRGGTGNFGYFASVDWSDQEGVFVTNGKEAYNVRGNFTFDPIEKLNITLSNSFISSTTAYNYNDGESWGFVGAVLLGQPQWAPISKSDPNSGGAAITTCPYAYEVARTTGQSLADVTAANCNPDRTFIGSNNFDRLSTMDNQVELERYIGSASVSYEPTDFWTVRGTVGYDSYTERGWDMIPNVPLKILDSDPSRSVTHVLGRTLTMEAATGLTFDLTSSLASETTFGVQYFKTSTEVTQASGTNFPPGAPTVGNGASRDSDEDFIEVKTLGLFVQQQFAYNDRIFLTPAVRFDNNSAFGDNLGAIIYPRVSLSYVIGEEAWFPTFFDEFRLRGAWGLSGKQPGAFDAVTLLSVNSVTLPDGSSGAGFSPSRTGNDDLKPETGSEIELGFDAGVLDNRLGLEFTYFDQVTRDALVLRPVPPSTGFSQGVWDNVGEVQNKGFELGLDVDVIDATAVNWHLRLGYTHLKSTITKLDEPIAIGGRGLQEHREGYAYGAYFMRPVTLNDAGEIVIADEAEYVGQPTPTYEGSIASTLTLFNDRVRLYALANFMGGHQQINYTEVYQCRTAFGTCEAKYERDENGQPTDMAILKADPSANFQPYHFLYDADYLKLRTVSVQYNLPDHLINRFGADALSLRVVGTNLLTITDYPGVDPEINSQGRQNASQREFFSAGQTRQFTVGLTLSF